MQSSTMRKHIAKTASIAIASILPLPGIREPVAAASTFRATVNSPQYEVIDLGEPAAGARVHATSVSPNGKYVAGYYSTPHGYVAFLWSHGKFRSLAFYIAWAVNDAGVVVGNDVPNGRIAEAVCYKDGKTHYLFAGHKDSYAFEVDNSGRVYGIHGKFVFVRYPDGRTRYLDESSGRNGYFRCANEKGDVVMSVNGYEPKPDHQRLWDGSVLHNLPSPVEGNQCRPTGMNARGGVVGMFWTRGNKIVPMCWRDCKPRLIHIPANCSGYASGINDSGDIVGNLQAGVSMARRPFIVRRGRLEYLNDLVPAGVILDEASIINDKGEILALSHSHEKNGLRSYLLKPITRQSLNRPVP